MTRKLLARNWLNLSRVTRNTQCLRLWQQRPSAASYSQMSHAEQKAELRKAVKHQLRKLTAERMASESQAIAHHVLQSHIFHQRKWLGIYLHCAKLREVDTTLVVKAALEDGSNKECFVPLVEDQRANMKLLHLDSVDGLVAVPPFNILEPQSTYSNGEPRQDALFMAKPLELLLMPGLAFDRQGHRLGRGGGYYDSFINKCKQRAEAKGWDPPLLVALAFEAQMVDTVPTAAHDIDVDILITASNVFGCSSRGHSALLTTSPL